MNATAVLLYLGTCTLQNESVCASVRASWRALPKSIELDCRIGLAFWNWWVVFRENISDPSPLRRNQ